MAEPTLFRPLLRSPPPVLPIGINLEAANGRVPVTPRDGELSMDGPESGVRQSMTPS